MQDVKIFVTKKENGGIKCSVVKEVNPGEYILIRTNKPFNILLDNMSELNMSSQTVSSFVKDILELSYYSNKINVVGIYISNSLLNTKLNLKHTPFVYKFTVDNVLCNTVDNTYSNTSDIVDYLAKELIGVVFNVNKTGPISPISCIAIKLSYDISVLNKELMSSNNKNILINRISQSIDNLILDTVIETSTIKDSNSRYIILVVDDMCYIFEYDCEIMIISNRLKDLIKRFSKGKLSLAYDLSFKSDHYLLTNIFTTEKIRKEGYTTNITKEYEAGDTHTTLNDVFNDLLLKKLEKDIVNVLSKYR